MMGRMPVGWKDGSMKAFVYGAGVRGKRIVAKWGGTARDEILGIYGNNDLI